MDQQEEKKPIRWDEARLKWKAVTKEFVDNASGNVHVFGGTGGVRLDSFWAKIEYPALMKNKKVTGIIYHIVLDEDQVLVLPVAKDKAAGLRGGSISGKGRRLFGKASSRLHNDDEMDDKLGSINAKFLNLEKPMFWFVEDQPNLWIFEGFSIEVLPGRGGGVIYSEESRGVKVGSELLAGSAGIVISPGSIKAWETPDGEVEIDQIERERIVSNIRSAFRCWGFEIGVTEYDLMYHGSWADEDIEYFKSRLGAWKESTKPEA